MYSPFLNVIVSPATQACTDARHLCVFFAVTAGSVAEEATFLNNGECRAWAVRSTEVIPLGLSTSDMVYFTCRQGYETDGLMPPPPPKGPGGELTHTCGQYPSGHSSKY